MLLILRQPARLDGYTAAAMGAVLMTSVLVVLLARTGAELTWRLVTDDAPTVVAVPNTATAAAESVQPSEQASYRSLGSLELFGQPGESPGNANRAGAAPMTAPETQLDLALKGVMAYTDPDVGLAVISAQGRTKAHRPGDELPGGAVLERVYPDRIILLRGGEHEMLRLPVERAALDASSTEPNARPDPEAVTEIAELPELQAYRQTLLDNPEQLWEMVNVRPVMDGSELRGYHIQPRQHEALFRDAGLRADDIVTAINGLPLTDPSALGELIDELAGSDRLELAILRDGAEQTLTIEVES